MKVIVYGKNLKLYLEHGVEIAVLGLHEFAPRSEVAVSEHSTRLQQSVGVAFNEAELVCVPIIITQGKCVIQNTCKMKDKHKILELIPQDGPDFSH